jgi:alpha-N-arabinofuranosidase
MLKSAPPGGFTNNRYRRGKNRLAENDPQGLNGRRQSHLIRSILIMLKKLVLLALLGVLCSCAQVGKPANSAARFAWFTYEGNDALFADPPPAGHFQNPILAGFYPDPSITRAGDTFYMVTSSFAYFPGVPIFKSTDLVNWQSLGYVLSRPEQVNLANAGVSRGIFAPAIRFHNGVFYVITTLVDAGGNFIVTATDPAGPWSDPIFLPEIDGIDPSIFFDDDGKVYITHNGPPPGEPIYDGHRAIWMWEYDPKNQTVVKDSRRLLVNGGVDLAKQPIWIEAPHLYKINDWYYLLCAEGGTAEDHSEVVFRAKNLADPFVPFDKNPILTQRDLDPNRKNPIATAGHADIVQTPAGEWWAVFLATRNYHRDFFNTGRETFLLPVSWKDGWPVILPASTEIPAQPQKPQGLNPTANAAHLTGNFAWRDDFAGDELGFEWNLLRTANEKPYKLGSGKGVILTARPVSMAGSTQPAFIGRRQQHQTFTSTTRLELPLQKNVTAGILAFQSERAHYFLAVHSENHGHRIILETAAQSLPTEAKSIELVTSGDYVDFKIAGDRELISFYYRPEGEKNWLPVAENLDATILSTQKAGGFVGSYLGLHARLDVSAGNP